MQLCEAAIGSNFEVVRCGRGMRQVVREWRDRECWGRNNATNIFDRTSKENDSSPFLSPFAFGWLLNH